MSHISKKERKRVSRLITQKLLSLGVKDEITFIGSGRKKMFFKKDEKGQLILEKNKEGKQVPKQFEVEMPIAFNVLRRTVRELRNQTPDVINAFLGLSAPTAEPNDGLQIKG